MGTKILFIRRSIEEIPKEEEGTLAALRYHINFDMFTNVQSQITSPVIVEKTVSIEFDTEVVPEGNRRYPQKFRPIKNPVITPGDKRGPLFIVDLSDDATISTVYMHKLTYDLTDMSVFDEYDPAELKKLSHELREKLSK